MKYPALSNYVEGKLVSGGNGKLDVFSPLDGSVISTVPLSTKFDLDKAVEAAKKVFPSWSNKPIKERVQVFYKYKYLLEQNIDELTELVHIENNFRVPCRG